MKVTAEIAEARYRMFEEAKEHLDTGVCDTQAERDAVPFVQAEIEKHVAKWHAKWEEIAFKELNRR